jgi:hypothetical protein
MEQEKKQNIYKILKVDFDWYGEIIIKTCLIDAATSSSSPGTPFSPQSSMQTPNMNTPFGPETTPFQTPNFLDTGI